MERVFQSVNTLLVGSILMAVSAFMFFVQIAQGRTYRDCDLWPKVSATVVQSTVLWDRHSRCRPYVAYTYEVNGQRFEDDTLMRSSKKRWTKKECCALLDSIRIGDTLVVHVHPDKPWMGILLPEETAFPLRTWISPCLLALAGCAILQKELRRLLKTARKRKRKGNSFSRA